MLTLALGGGALFLHLQRQPDPPSPEGSPRRPRRPSFALAYFGKVTRKVRLDLRDDVLQKRLVEPVTHGFSRSLGGSQSKEY